VFFATVEGSTELPSTPIIQTSLNHWTWNSFYLQNEFSTTAEKTLTLNAGKSYYLEIYHINYAGAGFVRLEVDIPNTNINLINQKH